MPPGSSADSVPHSRPGNVITSMWRSTAAVLASCAALAATLVAIFTPKSADGPRPLDAADFAGKYYLGDGLGANLCLTLRDDGTYEFIWRGCMGTYAQGKGTVSTQQDLVVLHPPIQSTMTDTPIFDSRFIPIAWGNRRYLVFERGMDEFTACVNIGLEPRMGLHGYWYVRMLDTDPFIPAVPAGQPIVPAPWNERLLATPVTARVTVAENGGLEIDAGRAHGLVPGVTLFVELGEPDRVDKSDAEWLMDRGIESVYFDRHAPARVVRCEGRKAWLELRDKSDLDLVRKSAKVRSSMADFIDWRK
jgi:hypothetical protein